MKKGFTLVELIGVIIILGILALLAFPQILNLINNSKNKLSEAETTLLLEGSKSYTSDYANQFKKTNGNVYCIETKELAKGEYISNSLSSKSNYVKVTVNNDKYEYEIADTCEENLQ